jgi:hypothetical protein
MRKIIVAAFVVAGLTVVAPASTASAQEPFPCYPVNDIYDKVTGQGHFMYCIDDPRPSPLDLDPIA